MGNQYVRDEQLLHSIQHMAVSRSLLSARLAEAFSSLHLLTPEDFPEEKMSALRLEPATRFDGSAGETCVETDMRQEWCAIFAEARKPEYGEHLQNMPEELAENLIKRIVHLHQRFTERTAVDEWILHAKRPEE
jgi:hypothetical protein